MKLALKPAKTKSESGVRPNDKCNYRKCNYCDYDPNGTRRFRFGWFGWHNNPMRTHCQFTVKRPEKRVGLTVAPEQQPCGVQVVEWVGLAFTDSPILHPSCLHVCGGGRQLLFSLAELS